jgi:hypothetical protein
MEREAMTAAAPLQSLDAVSLAPVVAQALGRPRVELAGWTVQTLHGGAGEALGVYRVSGQAEHGGVTTPWSVILKVLGRPDLGGEPHDWNYWRREALVYQSGLGAHLPPGLTLPRCFGVVEQPGARLWLWLEDAGERPGAWTLADYGRVAFRIGQFNAEYLTGRPLPDEAWMSRGWLRGFVEANAEAMGQFPGALGHPLLRRAFPLDVADELLQRWSERHWYLQVLERLPQTLCHMDVFRRNLLAQTAPHDDYVLLDWSFTGQGAIGEELVPLIDASLAFFEVELASASDLEEIVRAGYLGGLRQAGWPGDPRLAELGYAAAATLRYSFGPLRGILWVLLDERNHPVVEQFFGRPVDEWCDAWAAFGRQLWLPLARRARVLAAELGI